jgi:hypothetical protein
VEFEVAGYEVEATMGRGVDGAPVFCLVEKAVGWLDVRRRDGAQCGVLRRRWLARELAAR